MPTIKIRDLWQQGSAIERKLNTILLNQRWLMRALQQSEVLRMFDVKRLVDAASRQTDATKAMKLAIDKMVEELRAAADDPEQLEAVLTAIEANTTVIALAATHGTPADTGQPVPPVVETE